MKKIVYQKPKVITKLKNIDAVEAGCCFTSCGGSPAPQSAGKIAKNFSKFTEKIERLKGDS
ncbi:hypothetical protein KY334_06300 [Candidatus Woesearchaeota archaeon]|nr:hypothetical protein [Candidatus Woesearchaeota archaeon]